ncbi:hypothetical protein Q8A67_005612 [Cirrhinus molitorella]|uniref:Ig-like domain-containing protein n=1 Tax=Cirrhinus molitorella TaxID=172907 RepID=A0AA88PYQ7_9TELE|nr:hypothetical protein Q8A67_005612 [Cirrhinus molitorella]
MRFFIFHIHMPFVYSELHTFMTAYTGINGQTLAEIPEFSAVTTLDGRQIDYYDDVIKKLIPRQDWMNKFASRQSFQEYTKVRERLQQINKINIIVLMEKFNHSHGVQTYQRMYGCWWDDETEDSNGFDQYSYNGEDLISLDLKEMDSSFQVVCHATGFYPGRVTITWLRNGQEHDEDVDLGELLPNADGTFQRTSTIYVPPDEWKKNHYVCVVEHMGKTIQKILTKDEIKSNNYSVFPVHCCGPTEAVIRLVLSALVSQNDFHCGVIQHQQRVGLLM